MVPLQQRPAWQDDAALNGFKKIQRLIVGFTHVAKPRCGLVDVLIK
jgi:hypothetical protein